VFALATELPNVPNADGSRTIEPRSPATELVPDTKPSIVDAVEKTALGLS